MTPSIRLVLTVVFVYHFLAIQSIFLFYYLYLKQRIDNCHVKLTSVYPFILLLTSPFFASGRLLLVEGGLRGLQINNLNPLCPPLKKGEEKKQLFPDEHNYKKSKVYAHKTKDITKD